MAHLLGSRYCIESLRNDVTDLQSAIVDVFSRVGPVRSSSWKYPDKMAADLDMTQLLEMYDWTEDEEECQVSHVCLLELLIDRLLLLMLAISQHLKQVEVRIGSAKSRSDVMPSSVGLVVKKFWSEIVQINKQVGVLQDEHKNQSNEVDRLRDVLHQVQLDHSKLRNGASVVCSKLNNLPFPLNDSDSRVATEMQCPESFGISRDEYNKSSQTYETAFIACDSCDLVQRNMKSVAAVLIAICQTQGLASCLQKQVALCTDIEWMNGSDVSRWLDEERKDFSRITTHFEAIDQKCTTVQRELEEKAKEREDLKAKVKQLEKDLRAEKQTKFTQRKYHEGKFEKLQNEQEDTEKKMHKEKEEIRQEKEILQQRVAELGEKLIEEKKTSSEIHEKISNMEAEMEERILGSKHVSDLEREKNVIRKDLSRALEQVSLLERERNMEKAKSKNASRQTEKLQSKQEGLLIRLDELQTENEEVRSDLLRSEEETACLQQSGDASANEIIAAQKEIAVCKDKISELEREKRRKEEEKEGVEKEFEGMREALRRVEEEQRLMIEYPDLNGPVNHNINGCGDVCTDMQNQVEANSLRIKVLEDQNAVLRNSITRMLHAQRSDSSSLTQSGFTSVPVPLWNVNSSTLQGPPPVEEIEEELDMKRAVAPPASISSSDAPAFIKRNQFPVSHKTKKASNLPPRPPSGKTTNGTYDNFVQGFGQNQKKASRPQSGSSISAYVKLKSAGMLRPKSVKPRSGENSDSEAHQVFSCYKCDKMYNSQADLEIHKSYCYG